MYGRIKLQETSKSRDSYLLSKMCFSLSCLQRLVDGFVLLLCVARSTRSCFISKYVTLTECLHLSFSFFSVYIWAVVGGVEMSSDWWECRVVVGTLTSEYSGM